MNNERPKSPKYSEAMKKIWAARSVEERSTLAKELAAKRWKKDVVVSDEDRVVLEGELKI